MFKEETRLPLFIGNTLRGALGQSLCDNFPIVYSTVFKVDGGESKPNPFVISAPYPGKGFYKSGDTLVFGITLFGSACEYVNDISGAARFMCNEKLSGAVLTESVLVYDREWSDADAEVTQPCDCLTVDFITPTEIKTEGGTKTDLKPDFGLIIDRVFSRISAIFNNYGDGEFIIPYSLIANKPFVVAGHNLIHKRINLDVLGKKRIDGFVGKICYRGDITRYIPYVANLGSQLHIGKKTTYSCGEYTFDLHGGDR